MSQGHTCLGTVQPPLASTVPHVFYKNTHRTTADATRTDDFSASLGTDQTDARTRSLVRKESTCAHCAVPHPTALSHALQSDFLPIVTPLIASEWEHILIQTNLFDNFHHVPAGIRQGFDMGTHSSPTVSYTPRNHSSALIRPTVIDLHISKELSLKRYTGPFSRSRLEFLIGPFRTSPLGLVLKPGSTDNYRLVQDFSFPRNSDTSSLNSEIDIEKFRCGWGTFNKVVEIILRAPEGLEAATLDVDSAFRCCPILPCQQHNFIIEWNDSFYIDHDAPFGAASSGGVFGKVADAKSAICDALGYGPNLNWVDDFLFFRLLSHTASTVTVSEFHSYTLEDLYIVATQLGWPWKESKTRPFNSSFRYLGFDWDIPSKRVSIPDEKKNRYLIKLSSWVCGNKFTRKEAESVLGTLVHCSLVLPNGRSRLPAISHFAASFNYTSSSFIRKTPNPSVLNDISWWRAELSSTTCGSILSQPPPPQDVGFWVDASTSWGIGIVFNGCWESWQLKTGWNKNGRDIGWAEFVALELGILFAIAHKFSNIHFLIHSDNQGVIYAIKGGKSRNHEQNLVLRRITDLLSTFNIHISPVYTPSAENLADRPSRGIALPHLPRSISSSLSIHPNLAPFISLAPNII
jgi:hypothetical protein